jgi:hypothetical protein
VILIEIEQIVGPEPRQIAAAAARHRVEDLPLADGVTVVERNGVDGGAMIKANPFITTPPAREP